MKICPHTIEIPELIEKTCGRCKQTKPLTEFYDTGRGGKQSMCKPCSNANGKERRAADKRERIRRPSSEANALGALKVLGAAETAARGLQPNGKCHGPGCGAIVRIGNFCSGKCNRAYLDGKPT